MTRKHITPPEMDPYAFLDDIRYDVIEEAWVPLTPREKTTRDERRAAHREDVRWNAAVVGGIALMLAGVLAVIAAVLS